jgi:hypothetical protein
VSVTTHHHTMHHQPPARESIPPIVLSVGFGRRGSMGLTNF